MRTLVATTAMSLLLLSAPAGHAIPDGGYIGLGLGGAIASGDRGVSLQAPNKGFFSGVEGTEAYEERVRTDFGSGMAFDLKFGYLIAGVVAPEISLNGHGNLDFKDGATYPSFVLRYHPVQHAIDHAERSWDVNVYVGAGYAIGGYAPDEQFDDDSKGWEGVAILSGVAFAWQVAESVSIGVDLRLALPQYDTFLIDRDDDVEAEASSTPSTMIIIPAAQVLFHL